MASMKRTLLEIVQAIIEDLDSDEVNSIDDTVEATQIANIVANTYFDLIANRDIPEHKELDQLLGLADASFPNYLQLPDDVARAPDLFYYNKSQDGDKEYRPVLWEDPERFLRRVSNRDSSSSDVTTVVDFNGGTDLLIINNKMPQYFTSFDDKFLVCDSWDEDIDDTLQTSKNRAWVEKVPTISITDTATFDIDSNYFPYLYNESLSRCSLRLKAAADEKAEQWSRRHKNFIQSEKHRFDLPNRRPKYGRT